MRNLKKFLALVLSMMMVLSLFVTASATSIDKDGKSQNFNDTKTVEFQTAIDVLNGMEVLKGDANPATGEPTGNFRPADNITRAEVAALVFRLATGQTDSKAADHYARYGSFSDVSKDAWYAGYVGYCANAGYIKGYAGETGPFGPSDPVTGYQALAMILRAMGYGVNGEFEGNDWRLHVSAVGTQTKILDGINNSHFGNETLYGPAPREVVAEIFFQAAMTGCVVYTPAYGYQTTTQVNPATGASIDTLGYRNFGLTKTDRIILGNQSTGETCTVLGSPVTVNDNDGARNGYPYAYPGSVVEWNADGVTAKTKTTNTLNLKVDTNLDWFGHRITAYYNSKDSGAKRTYAIYDEATTKYVYAKDGNVGGDLGKQAEAAKFGIDKGNGFHVSDRYGWISNITTPYAAKFAPINDQDHNLNVGSGVEADAVNNTDYAVLYKENTATPAEYVPVENVNVKEDTNTADGDDLATLPYGSEAATTDTQRFDVNGTQAYETGSYYRLISNGTGKVDVVITVAPELERVTEHNTTASVNTVRLSGQSDVVLDSPSANGGYDGNRNDSTFGELDNGFVRMNSLTADSEKAIGSLVVGWEIKGTNYSRDYKDDVNKDEASLYRYWLQPTTDTITGTVKYYHADTGEVVLDTGNGTKTLHFTLLPIVNYAVSPSWDPHNNNFYFYNNVQYTFKLDPTDASRYVDYSQGNDYEFLYATYADHKDGGLGTADLDYYVTGVNWDGKIVENAQFTTINKTKVTGRAYESLIIAKKNLGSANYGGYVGNEIQSGWYAGYAYNAGTKDLDVSMTGDFTYNTADGTNENWAGYAVGGRYWADKIHADYAGDTDGDGIDNDGVWRVSRDNVADGWAEQPTNSGGIGGLLLTPETKFIIVSGVGIGSNKTTVDIREGISALLGTSRNVTIDVKRFSSGVPIPEYNAYYKLVDEQYNNWYKESNHLNYSDDNWMVDTVILPKDAITWSDSNNLWFTNVTAPTGYYLANVHADTDTVEQYRMWNAGEEQKVFIDWAKSGFASANDINTHGNFIGTFYELTEDRTINGEKIYLATPMAFPEYENVYASQNSKTICNVDLKYDYTAVNNTSTARLTARVRVGDVTELDGSGNPLSNVYNVSGAKVTNLASGGTIKDLLSLNQAVSVGYRVTVAIVNDGHSVSQIYVTQIEAPGTW